MQGQQKTPRYAVRLVALVVFAGFVFFAGLRFFVPEGSKLTGSYDAKSLLYIASAPTAYQGSSSCGTNSCHEVLYNKWSAGAHGARKEQSKCEVCHGPQGVHPQKGTQLLKVRGDGDLAALCLSCHRKMKARSATGQPQISPQEHPYPHEGVLLCTQCHDPHSPGLRATKSSTTAAEGAVAVTEKSDTSGAVALASNCFACHGPSGRGGFAPELASKPYEMLKAKLTQFRSGEITSPMMNPIAAKMKDNEIDALARYFAGLS
ncbi:MAG TPA: c-type cytochrome [Gammaproteobacteria bacterium]